MTDTTELSPTGRAWVFGDDINTDDMYPGFAIRLSTADAAQQMFAATRPGWPALVRPGDIVVAGRNFGIGSSRPVPQLFQELGIAALVAAQFNTLFYRNCINYGLPALTVPDAPEHVTEGDQVCADITASRLHNITTGADYPATPLPEFLVSILRAGGLVNHLETLGHLSTIANA
jgi:3-isopropylmalate/(R)-2-methylmalate dehydratase small subunit